MQIEVQRRLHEQLEVHCLLRLLRWDEYKDCSKQYLWEKKDIPTSTNQQNFNFLVFWYVQSQVMYQDSFHRYNDICSSE